MDWMKGTGRIEINKGVRIVTNIDVCKYYQWLISRHFENSIKTQLPKYKAHITLVNQDIHGVYDYSDVLSYDGKEVEFSYNPTEIYHSPVNFWLPAKCEIEHEIKWLLAVDKDPKDWGTHLTICNMKFSK
jgi:hypothetical protein